TYPSGVQQQYTKSSVQYGYVPRTSDSFMNVAATNGPENFPISAATGVTVDTNSTRQSVSPRPTCSPEVIKKVGDAFKWLDDTMGTLNIGEKTLSPNPANFTTNGFSSNNSSTGWSAGNLDSGDEAWTNLEVNNGKTSGESSTIGFPKSELDLTSKKRSPYSLPPPPVITRNNLKVGIKNQEPVG
ncbi:unnamed protein product, partial [Allacma fusca]